MENNRPKIAAIIPALNEEISIAAVVRAVIDSGQVDEVIVVDDGSIDRTAEVAREAGARVLSGPNVGKGLALRKGVAATDASILLFADADLIGLRPDHVKRLLQPVKRGRAVMSIGIRDRWGFFMDMVPIIAPRLAISGERVMRREIFEALPVDLIQGYEFESTVNDYCQKKHLPIKYVKLLGLDMIIKEKKAGFWNGFKARLKMMKQIIGVRIVLLAKKW